MPKYKLSQKAERDLRDIWFYTYEKWSENQADKYIREIESVFFKILESPKGGKSFDHVRSGYRRETVKSHYVFYRLLQNDLVEIIRILHQRMDVEARLKE